MWALEARYGSDDAFDLRPNLRLVTCVVNRNELFADDVWEHGHTINFNGGNVAERENGASALTIPMEQKIGTITSAIRYFDNTADIDDLMQAGKAVVTPNETDIMAWLRDVYKNSRGFELGSFDASLLPIVWKKQSANWDNLALGYINDIVARVHSFILSLLDEICEDERIRTGIYNAIMEHLTERYKRAIDHTKFILSVERSGTPLTTNHYFADNLEKR